MEMHKVYLDRQEFKRLKNNKLTEPEKQELLLRNFIVPLRFNKTAYFNSIKERHKDRPAISTLYLLVTDACNLDCRYCFIEPKIRELGKKTNMTEETAKKAIDLFSKTATDNPMVIFYGGEPLLNFEVIKFATNYGKNKLMQPHFTIVTNGTLITNKIAKFFKKQEFNVGVSIDGRKNTHDKMRQYWKQGKGTYSDVRKGLRELIKAGVPFGASCTIGNHNKDCLNNEVKHLIAIGAKGIGFNLMHYCESNKPSV
ncbi:radical SAM protein [archaeon]|nr:radical SAM protein [archaeon]